MEISSSSLRYATGVALRTPVDLQQLFRACGALPLGSNANIYRSTVKSCNCQQREGGLTDDISSRTAAAAGVPSHTTFTQSHCPYHRVRNVLSMPRAVASIDDSDDSSHLRIRISQKDPSPSLIDRTSRSDHHQPHQPRQPIGF